MQLWTYLIRNWILHVINSHVHLTVTILSGKRVKQRGRAICCSWLGMIFKSGVR